MIEVKLRYPNYFDFRMPVEKTEVENVKDILDIDFVNRFAKSDHFSRFTVEVSEGWSQHLLMAEYNDGHYRAMAYITGVEINELLTVFPKWVHP